MKRETLEQIAVDILSLSMEHNGEEDQIIEEVKNLSDEELQRFVNEL
jgi:hypothetical protein